MGDSGVERNAAGGCTCKSSPLISQLAQGRFQIAFSLKPL